MFLSERNALIDLIKWGASTIGTDISRPNNWFGNCYCLVVDDHYFSSSSSYLAPNINFWVSSKELFNLKVTPDMLKLVLYILDIFVNQTKEDFINGIDTVLKLAITYSQSMHINDKCVIIRNRKVFYENY